MNGGRWMVLTFILALGGLAAGYVVWQSYAPPASATRPLVPQERQFSLVIANVGASETREFLRWIPGTIVVHTGDTVILEITNTDPDSAHGFGLPEANIFVQQIPPGQAVTVRFVAARPGIYLFSCANAGCAADHAQQKGQLIVLGTP